MKCETDSLAQNYIKSLVVQVALPDFLSKMMSHLITLLPALLTLK